MERKVYIDCWQHTPLMVAVKCKYCPKKVGNPGAMRFHLAVCPKAPESVRKKNKPKSRGKNKPQSEKKPVRVISTKEVKKRVKKEIEKPENNDPQSGESPISVPKHIEEAQAAPVLESGPEESAISLPPAPSGSIDPSKSEDAELAEFTKNLKQNLRDQRSTQAPQAPPPPPTENEEATNTPVVEIPPPPERPKNRASLYIGAGVILLGVAVMAVKVMLGTPTPPAEPAPPSVPVQPRGARSPWE